MNIDPSLLQGRGVASIVEHGQGNAGVPPGNAGAGKPSKYRNKKVVMDGITFDSKKEADRYTVLKLMEKNGKIHNLTLQDKWDLVVNRIKICAYRSDFRYIVIDSEGPHVIVEDVKGFRTREYKIKKSLMLACYGIELREV